MHKPPLGLRPKYVADAQRLAEVRDAIQRFIDAGLPINTEWVAEYNALVNVKRTDIYE